MFLTNRFEPTTSASTAVTCVAVRGRVSGARRCREKQSPCAARAPRWRSRPAGRRTTSGPRQTPRPRPPWRALRRRGSVGRSVPPLSGGGGARQRAQSAAPRRARRSAERARRVVRRRRRRQGRPAQSDEGAARRTPQTPRRARAAHQQRAGSASRRRSRPPRRGGSPQTPPQRARRARGCARTAVSVRSLSQGAAQPESQLAALRTRWPRRETAAHGADMSAFALLLAPRRARARSARCRKVGSKALGDAPGGGRAAGRHGHAARGQDAGRRGGEHGSHGWRRG